MTPHPMTRHPSPGHPSPGRPRQRQPPGPKAVDGPSSPLFGGRWPIDPLDLGGAPPITARSGALAIMVDRLGPSGVPNDPPSSGRHPRELITARSGAAIGHARPSSCRPSPSPVSAGDLTPLRGLIPSTNPKHVITARSGRQTGG